VRKQQRRYAYGVPPLGGGAYNFVDLHDLGKANNIPIQVVVELAGPKKANTPPVRLFMDSF
jgi:hypothetical protein